VIGAPGLQKKGALENRGRVRSYDFADAAFPHFAIVGQGAGPPSGGRVSFDRTHRIVIGSGGLCQEAAPVGSVGAHRCDFAAADLSGLMARRNGDAIGQERTIAFGAAGRSVLVAGRCPPDRRAAHYQDKSGAVTSRRGTEGRGQWPCDLNFICVGRGSAFLSDERGDNGKLLKAGTS